MAPVVLLALVLSQAPDGGTEADPLLLKLLFDKTILTKGEYEAATAGLPPPEDGRSPLMNKWAASLYGFIELDVVGDSTQSAFEQSANSAIARPGTFEGDHPRVSVGARNSRLGLKLSTPVAKGFRAGAIIETDLLGNTVAPTKDLAVFTGGGPRIRHLAITVETPFVDVLIGQWWQLFGWQPNFFPNTVEIQGVIAETYGRAPQLRLSHVFRTAPVNVEVAFAIARSAERLFGFPDFQAGVRVAMNQRTALRTSGATSTRTDAMMFGLSGVLRRFDLPVLGHSFGWGLSFDVLVPIIAGSVDHRKNALTLNAAFVTGEGIADFQSGFTAGIPATGPIDPGLAVIVAGTLRKVAWRTFRVGLQYYLPPNGAFWISANWAQNISPNAAGLGPDQNVYVASRVGDISLWWSFLGALRLGVEYALGWQRYADGVEVLDHRGIFAAFFLF